MEKICMTKKNKKHTQLRVQRNLNIFLGTVAREYKKNGKIKVN